MNVTTLAHYIALIIGLLTLLIGVAAVLKPEPMSKKFGISVNGSALPYVVSTGIRDVFIGLTVLILFYKEQWSTLGAINLCIGIIAVSDFLVVQKHGDKKTSWIHLFGAIAVTGYGTWLILSY